MGAKTTLKNAILFHGHLGPYLVLGLRAGEFALKELKVKKYFAISVGVWGAAQKPQSCLVDGLQLSTGATYGKGNIVKFPGKRIRIIFRDVRRKNSIRLTLRDDLATALSCLKGHSDAEIFARKIFKLSAEDLFCYNLRRI